mmetsp:Transcript_24541/g.55389  ORF Transcript_24541/g.55389 Transcript_24541/m.55389 type:complete len:642 (-) Transcript_24541:4277-6202(-)
MYRWKSPFQIHGEQFVSDMYGFALVSMKASVNENLKSHRIVFIAEIPIESIDLSHILWNCDMYDNGWKADFCVPIDFTASQVSCSCRQNGLMAVSISTNDICGDGRMTGQEQCDDGNQISNDGCSADCQLEQFFTCEVGNSVLTSQCTPLQTRGCSPQMFGSDCDKMCLVQMVNSECPQQPKLPIHKQVELIDGSQGGEILLHSWGSVNVPAMVFEGEIIMTIFLYDEVPLTQDSEHGPTIVLGPSGTTLARPLTLSLDMKSFPETQKSSYTFCSLNSASLTWEYVETQVDFQTNSLQCTISQLSVFAIRLKPTAAGTSPKPSASQETVMNETSSAPAVSNQANQQTSVIILAVSGIVGICTMLLIGYRRRAIWSLITKLVSSKKASNDPVLDTHETEQGIISLQVSSVAKSNSVRIRDADSPVDCHGAVISHAQTDYFTHAQTTNLEQTGEIGESSASMSLVMRSNDSISFGLTDSSLPLRIDTGFVAKLIQEQNRRVVEVFNSVPRKLQEEQSAGKNMEDTRENVKIVHLSDTQDKSDSVEEVAKPQSELLLLPTDLGNPSMVEDRFMSNDDDECKKLAARKLQELREEGILSSVSAQFAIYSGPTTLETLHDSHAADESLKRQKKFKTMKKVFENKKS